MPPDTCTIHSTCDISIIIISFNTCAITRACLRSIYAHVNDLNAEVIVVDNNSKDDSVAMIATEFPDVILIANAENTGFAAANNQAMHVSRGRYFLLLNSDTEILDAVLQNGVKYMDQHLDIGVLGCRVHNPDGTLQPTCFGYPSLLNLALWTSGLAVMPIRTFQRQSMPGWKRDSERSVDVVTGCFMLVRDRVVAEVGGLDEDFFFFGEETDWCYRIRNAGWSVRFAPVGTIMHIGGASLSTYKRGLLLSNALLLLHKKHSSPSSAAVARCLIWFYWASRFLAFGLLSLVVWSKAMRARRLRCGQLLRHFHLVDGSFAGLK